MKNNFILKLYKMKNRMKLILAFIALILIISACKKSEDAKPGTNEVLIQNMAFNPSSITIAKHTSIKWTNKDSNTHTVTSNSGLFNSGNLSNGGTFSFTFDSAGTFNYHCAIHSSMTATVIVQ
jgi:plastocyanin